MIYSSVFFKTFKGFSLGTCYFCLHGLAQWLTSGSLLRYLPFKDPFIGYCCLTHCSNYSRTYSLDFVTLNISSCLFLRYRLIVFTFSIFCYVTLMQPSLLDTMLFNYYCQGCYPSSKLLTLLFTLRHIRKLQIFIFVKVVFLSTNQLV